MSLDYSCKESARLLSEKQDRSLTLPERTALQAHLAICRGCRALGGQMDFLRRAVRRLSENKD